MMMKTKVLDADGLRRTVNRLSHEVVEKNKGVQDVVLVGIQNTRRISRTSGCEDYCRNRKHDCPGRRTGYYALPRRPARPS